MVFNRPEHVKEIFAGDPEVFHAGKGNAILGPVMGEHSLLLVDCAQHKRARKLLMPAFNGHALRGYEDGRRTSPATEVGRWQRARVPLAGADERADPRGHPPGRLRRHRRAAGSPSCGRWSTGPSTSARRCCLGWGFPRCSGSARGRRTVENQAALDRVIYAEIARAPRRARPRRPDRRAVPAAAGPGRRATGGPAHRRGAARPAGHAAARRPRDHRDRAGLGALRARPRPRPAGQAPRAPPAPATTTTSRRCSRSRCGCTR